MQFAPHVDHVDTVISMADVCCWNHSYLCQLTGHLTTVYISDSAHRYFKFLITLHEGLDILQWITSTLIHSRKELEVWYVS